MAKQYSQEFFDYLEKWLDSLKEGKLSEIAPDPEKAAVFGVDITKGFCSFGPLSSERVGTIVDPIVEFLKAAWDHGIRNYVLPQDTHDPEAEEFDEWPPHCIRGTEEAETVDAIQALPFFNQMIVIEKNTINVGAVPEVLEWIEKHPEVDTFINIGDCTDLCVYQQAMYFKTSANQQQIDRKVIVPVDCVDTYDRPVSVAQEQGGFPHPGELIHDIFLYHMALNGIEIYKKLTK